MPDRHGHGDGYRDIGVHRHGDGYRDRNRHRHRHPDEDGDDEAGRGCTWPSRLLWRCQRANRYSGRSNRSSPYAISSATGPDGRTYYYLEDAAAVSAYGRRERVLSVKDAIPLANSAAGFQAAANALYDVTATFLERAAAPLESYLE